MKSPKTLDTVYIYIYIVRFNKIKLRKHRKTMSFSKI